MSTASAKKYATAGGLKFASLPAGQQANDAYLTRFIF